MQNRGFLHFLFLILWFIWEEGCLISGRRSRKAWSLMRQPLQTAGKPHPSVCLGHAQSRRDSLMRCAQWADVKKSWFLKKLHRQCPNPCRNSSKSSPGWLFPGYLYFLHFWGITRPPKFHFMEIRWQNFKNKQILSAQEDLLLLTPATYHACNVRKDKV